jgi:lipopolysaccharide heptosyltransferase II
MTNSKNFLIARTDRIGDVILSLPMAELIKKQHKDCRITFLVRDYTKDLLLNHPFIDEVITLDEKNNKIKLSSNIKKIAKHKFGYAIVVNPSFKLTLIIFLSGIKVRIGSGFRLYSILFNRRVYVHRKYAGMHELEFNVDLLRQIGIAEKINKRNVKFNLQVDIESGRWIDALLVQNKIDKTKPMIIIHPGSGGSAVDLPIEKFKELINNILLLDKFYIVLTGTNDEKKLCDELKTSDKILNFAGMLSLKQLTALIKRCDIFIANSTGPLHIAAALDKYVIGFYPKITVCSAKRWGPYTTKSFVFEPTIDCKSCSRKQCEKYNCMSFISVEKIIEKIQQIYLLSPNSGEGNV